MYYQDYLTCVDVLHYFRNLHCWTTQVSAIILACLLKGKLRCRNKYCSFLCPSLLHIIYAISYPDLLKWMVNHGSSNVLATRNWVDYFNKVYKSSYCPGINSNTT